MSKSSFSALMFESSAGKNPSKDERAELQYFRQDKRFLSCDNFLTNNQKRCKETGSKFYK